MSNPAPRQNLPAAARTRATRVAVVAALLGGCGGGQSGASRAGPVAAPVEATQSAAEAPPPTDPALAALGLGATALVVTAVSATSTRCATCHTASAASAALRDDAGRDVSPYSLWRGSMMANATRDPYWRAAVSAELAQAPAAKEAIEATCLRCHAPAMEIENRLQGGGKPAALAWLRKDNVFGQLGRDGVSCVGCHRQSPRGQGQPRTFSGHLPVQDDGAIYGPHGAPLTRPMRVATGFTPTPSAHVAASAVCASCHTLTTETLDGQGRATGGHHLEQAPYLEWQASAYSTEAAQPGPDARDCQGCHMPTRDADGAHLATRIARRPSGVDFPQIAPRNPFGRHLLVGGNTVVPAMLRDARGTLAPDVPAEAFDATIASARAQLREATAALQLRSLVRDGDTARALVEVVNLTGHKLPTGTPSRRLWLRARLRDADGKVLVASGEVDARGRIVGADGQPLAFERRGGPSERHVQRVNSADDVAIWGSVLAGDDGKPTFRLLAAAGFAKDDRILPKGWRATAPGGAATGPVGVGNDPDFGPGSDGVELALALPAAAGPVTLELTLLYQALAPRWIEELLAIDTAETRAFGLLWARAEVGPEIVAELRAPLR